VGKTSSSESSVGVELKPSSAIVTRNNDAPLKLRRNTSDGAILQFAKDGTTVGKIGTATNELEIKTSGSRYLELQDIVGLYNSAWTGNLQMTPTVSSVDLGNTSTQWDKLFLSGGVYLGGTGSANKLDDYEEGTWTPTLRNGGTISNISHAYYTKIGNQVRLTCFIVMSSITNNSSQFQVGGVPFSVSQYGPGSITYMGGFDGAAIGMSNCMAYNSWIYFHRNDGVTTALANSAVQGLSHLILGVTYTAS